MLLRLDNIGKIYNSNDLLVVGIRGINLEFDYNEFVTIEGESGSGKSTLLNVIGANDTYEEGELWFNDMETSHYSEDDWEKYREKNITTIFQDFNIIDNLTTVENVELALFRLDDKKERRRVALELLDKVGLTKQATQRASKLSGGEKQRCVIARALAKDSPIILADEPTGNLDVKASKEVARILKEVSKDKLVIVVTHNPEFFIEYATRRVRVFDGQISEDRVISKPEKVSKEVNIEEKRTTNLQNFKNTMHIGFLNYKSRPKFTLMMTFALFICTITLFMIQSIIGTVLIKDTQVSMDKIGIEGKLILSSGSGEIDDYKLDEFANITNSSFTLLDRDMSQFEIDITKQSSMNSSYVVNCIYDPIKYNEHKGEATIVIPGSVKNDVDKIVEIFTNANVGINNIKVKETLDTTNINLYLSNYDLVNNGPKIQAINSIMRFNEIETPVYSFKINDELIEGSINVVNSVYYNALNKKVVFETKPDKSYTIIDDMKKDNSLNGIVIEMNKNDYNYMFKRNAKVNQACLYYENDELAKDACKLLPSGYMGMLSTNKLYVQGVGDIYTNNIMYYIGLIAVSILFGMLIVVIFMRSVKIYQSDFAVYKTLGISRKTSSRSLYMEMFFIFLPTVILLPLVSLIVTILPGSELTFIGFGNYIFIELMILLIVEMVAFLFNKSINSQSIRKSLKRGSK